MPTLPDRSRPWLERLPVIVVAAIGVALTIGILAVGARDGSVAARDGSFDGPRWYPDEAKTVEASATSTSRPSAPPEERSGAGAGQQAPMPDAAAGQGPDVPTSGAPPTVADRPPGWQPVSGLESGPGELADVDIVGSGGDRIFVAAGVDDRGAVVLTSTGPGSSWLPMGRDGLGEDSYARAVAATATEVLVAGGESGKAALWEWHDESWRRTAASGTEDGSAVFADVAIEGDTAVVVGFDRQGTGFWTRVGAGERFSAVPQNRVEGAIPGQTLVRGVVATDEGFLAVGQVGDRAHRWLSVDGHAWDGEPLPEGGQASPLGVSADGAIVGYDGLGGVMWLERGDEYRTVRLPEPSAAPQVADAVAVRNGSYLVVGREAGAVRCWQLHDQMTDAEPCRGGGAPPDAASVHAVVAHPGGWLAVGSRVSDGRRLPGIWQLDDESQE